MARIAVLAKPNARRSAVLDVRADEVVVALAAPPVDGAANEELVRVVAAALGVPRRDVAVVRGASSRKKLLEVDGLDADEARRRLAAAVPPARG